MRLWSGWGAAVAVEGSVLIGGHLRGISSRYGSPGDGGAEESDAGTCAQVSGDTFNSIELD